MRAAFFAEPGGPVLVEEVTARPPGAHDLVVRLGAAGICHTDVLVASGGLPCPPAILGHEGAGVVDYVGAEVEGFQIGDRVVGLTIARCGRCTNCRRGKPYLCETAGLFGPERADRVVGGALVATNGLGTFAEAMTVGAENVIKVDSDLPDAQLALVGCAFTTGFGAVFNTARVEPGSVVVVIGCGGVGQAVIQAARIAKADRIVAVDPIPAKRELAVRSGATEAHDPSGKTLRDIVDETGLAGADYVFDTVGKPATIQESYAALRRGGVVIAIGVGDLRTEIPIPGTLVVDSKSVMGCVFGSADVDQDIRRILYLAHEGLLDIDSLVSHRVPLDGVAEAMRALEAGEALRPVLIMG
jgi:S-(hydroxymethyl)glutathione dehydrogenase/alcohol dehydrogenase